MVAVVVVQVQVHDNRHPQCMHERHHCCRAPHCQMLDSLRKKTRRPICSSSICHLWLAMELVLVVLAVLVWA